MTVLRPISQIETITSIPSVSGGEWGEVMAQDRLTYLDYLCNGDLKFQPTVLYLTAQN